MSLVLEIEFLAGVCRAARQPSDDAPDWPPQPDRVFSALVSSWAARGERAEERAALEWLETQAAPTVHASAHTARTTPDVFVPPNDAKASKANSSKAEEAYLKVLPERRSNRQRRHFPVATPEDPIMELKWEEEPDAERFAALDAVARDVGYLGHSASLARFRFLRGDGRRAHAATIAQRRIYPGRLVELERAYRAKPVRPDMPPGASVGTKRLPKGDVSGGESDWLVLKVVEGVSPDIRAAALICRLLRQTLMSGYRHAGLGRAIPEEISGHAPNRTPTRFPHLAVAPLAFVSFPHADGRVMGFALIPPRGLALREIPHFDRAFNEIAPYSEKTARREIALEGAPLRERLRLAPTNSDEKRSLSPSLYLDSACVWASVTPIVLDRHFKRGGDREIRELVARACENAGLPRPNPDRIQTGKHSAFEGAPSARPPAGAPPWMRWKAPESLSSRPLVHAVVDFEKKTPGPVLLGAGRFTGFGLCRPLGD